MSGFHLSEQEKKLLMHMWQTTGPNRVDPLKKGESVNAGYLEAAHISGVLEEDLLAWGSQAVPGAVRGLVMMPDVADALFRLATTHRYLEQVPSSQRRRVQFTVEGINLCLSAGWPTTIPHRPPVIQAFAFPVPIAVPAPVVPTAQAPVTPTPVNVVEKLPEWKPSPYVTDEDGAPVVPPVPAAPLPPVLPPRKRGNRIAAVAETDDGKEE